MKVMVVLIVILNEAKHKIQNESVVFSVRQTQVLAYFPFATSCCYFLVLFYDLLSSMPFAANNFAANEKHMVLKSACESPAGDHL